MISWIQRTFQHHFRLVFGLLLAITIIAFVFTIGATPGLGGGSGRYAKQEFFGTDLSSREAQNRIFNDAALSVSLQSGFMGLSQEALQTYALQRLAALHLADQYRIPPPTEAELERMVRSLRAFAGPNGFDTARYNNFRASLKTSSEMTEGDVARVLAQDWRASRIQELLAGPGFVLPQDVRFQVIEGETNWTVAMASIDYAAFAPEIRPTDAELTKFFEDNRFRYEIPPRVRAEYVEFPTAAYLPKIAVTESEIKAYYDSNPARFTKAPATPAEKDAKLDPAADFAAVRPAVETALRQERALRDAGKAASDLAYALFDRKIPQAGVAGYLAEQKLTPKPLPPFTRDAGPAELGGSPEIADAAFRLGPNRYYSDALPSPNGAVILLWKETESVRQPAFAEVRAKVAADYTENEKRKRFVEAGRSFRTRLEARLKAGDDFEKAVATAASETAFKAEAKTLPPFTIATPPAGVEPAVIGSLGSLEKGQVSEMAFSSGKGDGIVVHVLDKKVPDITETSPSYTATRNNLAGAIARYNANAYLNAILQAEQARSQPVAP